ncbi:MAG: dynamin family protein [Planctomycetota bacterium]
MGEYDHVNIASTREALEKMSQGIDEIFEKVVEDHKTKNLEVLPGFLDFQLKFPKTHIERAKELLKRKDFKIAVSGGFSAGKSTLINAIIGMPDMLPTQAGECTMSITLVSNPAGGDEHVEAKYFTRQQALQYVYTNARYNAVLVKHKDEVLNNYTEEKAIKGIKEGAEMASKVPEHKAKKDELDELLYYLDQYKDRLGTVHIDKIQNAPLYLTTDHQNRGLGHLLLIEQVHLFRKMDMFKEKGSVIIDLPGSDSVNERQRDLSFNYLRECDAIMIVLGPRGLDANAQTLWTKLSKEFNDVKDKLFFVINMFDSLPADQLKKAEIERVLKSQVIDQLINFNLDPTKLYLTSGLRQEFEQRKAAGAISPTQLVQLEGIHRDCEAKLGSLDENIIPELRNKIVRCLEPKDGGVAYLRDELTKYLERDIQCIRLKEVYLYLNMGQQAINTLLGPEQKRYQAIAGNKVGLGQQVTEFFEKTKETFMEEVQMIPNVVAQVVPKIMQGMAPELNKMVDSSIKKLKTFKFAAKPNKRVKAIKEEIIEHMKDTLTDSFAKLVSEKVPAPITSKLFESVEKTKVGVIIEKISQQLGKDYGTGFQRILDDFNKNIIEFTYMRAIEETWPLQDAEIEVADSPGNRSWDEETEVSFKKDMTQLFTGQISGLSQHLGGIIGRHYRYMIMKLVENFNNLIDTLFEVVRSDPMAVALPMALIVGDDDDEKIKLERALISYMERWDSLKADAQPAVNAFGSKDE